MAQTMAIASSRLRHRGAFYKGINCTPARRGPPFAPPKGGKSGSRGTDSPLTNPFLSLAVLDTNLDFFGAKNPNPYCAQIRSQGSRRRICPLPVPLPRGGGGAVWASNCLFYPQSRQRDFLRLTPRPIAVPAALRCPKKSSRCSLARFFRPLRVLRLAASATGGARLRPAARRPPIRP